MNKSVTSSHLHYSYLSDEVEKLMNCAVINHEFETNHQHSLWLDEQECLLNIRYLGDFTRIYIHITGIF